MTIIVATPEPTAFPPRVRLDIDSEGAEFVELTVLRDGRPIRQQPKITGLAQTVAYDYEAPFGEQATYTATGSTTTGWNAIYNETWANLDGWTIPYAPATVAGGGFASATPGTHSEAWRDLPVEVGSPLRLVMNRAQFTGSVAIGLGPVGATQLPSGLYLQVDWGATRRTLVAPASGSMTLEHSQGAALGTLSVGTARVQAANTGTPSVRLRVYNTAHGAGFIGPFQVQTINPATPFSVSTTTTLAVTSAWLIHPSQPSFSTVIEDFASGDISVQSSTDDQREYQVRQSVFQPSGRREAVVFPLGNRSAGSWTLVLNTKTLDARNQVLQMLDDQAPLMLRSPASAGWDLPDGWYAVGDVRVDRPIDIGTEELRRITLPLTRVAEPPVLLAPSLTWGDLVLRGVKWGELLTHTWLEALMGEV